MDDLKEVKQDVKDIKQDVVTLKEIAAENTVILREHMKRTELNEVRIRQLEYFIMGGLLAIIAAIVKLMLK